MIVPETWRQRYLHPSHHLEETAAASCIHSRVRRSPHMYPPGPCPEPAPSLNPERTERPDRRGVCLPAHPGQRNIPGRYQQIESQRRAPSVPWAGVSWRVEEHVLLGMASARLASTHRRCIAGKTVPSPWVLRQHRGRRASAGTAIVINGVCEEV
jgi:hypothetical protein